MGFLSGTATFERYWITKDPTSELGEEHIQVLKKFAVGKRETGALEEPKAGYVAGDHLLDTKFAVEKNILGDALHFGIRVDSDQIPSPLRNAWMQMELLPLMADSPGAKPTKQQREEAKELVEARCAEETATGKYRRMAHTPILWDAANDELYVGSNSSAANELCVELLERSFGIELDHVSSGKLAQTYASEYKQLDALYELSPAAFTEEEGAGTVCWWNGIADNYDYLGNEFLLWLWWRWETDSDTMKLSDDTEVCGIFSRSLTLDCPLGESGKETIAADSPVMLPEAALAVRSGKLPRKAGLTLIRNDQQFDFALKAEAFSVSGAKLTELGSDGPMEMEDRLQSLRTFSETLDLLFDVFCEHRLAETWAKELRSMQRWLKADKPIRRRSAA